MTMKQQSAAAFLPAFFIAEYVLFVATVCLFAARVPEWSVPAAFLLLPALFFYPLMYLAPAIVLTSGAAAATWTLKERMPVLRGRIIGTTAFLTVFATHLFLLLDAGLYFRYAYHINPHVINIFTTPGGFDGMGLRSSEIITLGAGIGLVALIHLTAVICFIRFPGLSFAGTWDLKLPRLRRYAVFAAVFGALFLTTFLTYTYEHYSMNPKPLLAADAIPLYIRGTSGSFFKWIGIRQPDRDATRVKLKMDVNLENYPQKPIVRSPDHPKYNVVWLACESWAVRLFTPEIMPKTADFAKKGVHFRRHYSGGNVTRQGMFSMFYGLPASYWHPFFAARRGPVFIDWLKEDGYGFDCITSSKFTYPEFDQTIFFQVPHDRLYSDDKGLTYRRDQRNVKRLIRAIEDGADSGKPFFAFMFFESPHNPYEFPPEAVCTEDYIDPFVATQVSAKDGPRIFRRAANCARHLDMCLDGVYQTLERKDLLKNTIVIIAGDHGEEFYEHDYLGHSSSFVNEQTRTPLILYYPGIKPGEYTHLSSHLDIVPMLAKLFGVRNDPKDYSCGFDLLSAEKPLRRYTLIADWSRVFFTGEKYKSLIPLDAVSYAKQVITDSDDRPLPSVDPFYKEHNQDLIEVQRDLTRFTAPKRKESHPAAVAGTAAGIFAVLAGAAVWIIVRARKRKKSE